MNTWKPETFSINDLNSRIESKEIYVPAFQRGLVWSSKQKEGLIDSLKKGYPFGSILMYEDAKKSLRIIDGLQRVSTISEFVSNPSKYFNVADIDDDDLKRIVDKLKLGGNQELMKDKVQTVFVNWIKSHKTMQQIKSIQFYEFVRELSSIFPSAVQLTTEIIEIIKPILNDFIEICNFIMNIQVPAIVYRGDEKSLPDLFERINTLGTTLTKYQIYKASWITDEIQLDGDFRYILEHNRDKYDLMNNGVIDIEEYDSNEFMKKSQVDVFDLIFGFGKGISKKYPYLFSSDDNKVRVESIGFNLINACLLNNNNDMQKLNHSIRENLKNDKEINEFLRKIDICIGYVDKMLKPITHFKLNKREKVNILHSELQVCSLIASLFINKHISYKIDGSNNVLNKTINLQINLPNWEDYFKDFKKFAVKKYVEDILSSKWSGTGDKKLDQVVKNRNYYSQKIEWRDFESTLNSWFKALNNDRLEYKRIAKPKNPELVVLSLIYLDKFSMIDNYDDKYFDVEHLLTKKLLANKIDIIDSSIRIPISSVGNLCLLPEYINRSKKDKTIYDDESYLERSKLGISEIESKYSFTEKNDFNWINNGEMDQKDFINNYNEFINTRFDRIKAEIMKVYDRI